jgi:hypothetical protein
MDNFVRQDVMRFGCELSGSNTLLAGCGPLRQGASDSEI